MMRSCTSIILLLLLVLVAFSSAAAAAAASVDAANEWDVFEPNEDIYRMQNELLEIMIPGADNGQEVAKELESNLEQAVQEQVNRLKTYFRETPRPAERLDDATQTTSTLAFGTSLWYLIEIPQWWITAQVVKVLEKEEGDDQDRLLIHLTASGEEFEAIRGPQVRTVLEADHVAWHSEYLRDLGELARIHDNADERRDHYQKAIDVDPTNPHALDNLGLYYMDNGDFENGEKYLLKSIEVQPKWYHAYYNLGILYRDNPRHEKFASEEEATKEALRLFERAFQLNPLFLESLWNVADHHAKLQNHQDECYHWRILRVFNRNRSPDERDFGIWHDDFEEYTTRRIHECMTKMLEQDQAGTARGEEL